MSISRLAGDNVYNSENDFDNVFQFSVYGPADTTDWVYADDIYVAVVVHKGGDVRGNYGACRMYKADNLAESGFLDWTLGWRVEFIGRPEFLSDDMDEWTDEQIAVLEDEMWYEDKKLTERCSPGYASLPASELPGYSKSDRVYWYDGKAYVLYEGMLYRSTPYHWHGEVNTPDNGTGYICDANIDTEDFLKQTLGEELPNVPSNVVENWDVSEDEIIPWIERSCYPLCRIYKDDVQIQEGYVDSDGILCGTDIDSEELIDLIQNGIVDGLESVDFEGGVYTWLIED
jgi:hypothetical protein